MTRWFVLLRFGSCKSTPRWGGHKDRVSFNPFPLSNGHLDRVSFSPQSIGTLSPHKDHHNLVSLALITKVLRTRMGNKKSDPRDKNSNEHKYLSLTSHYMFGAIPDLGEDLISWLCLGVKSRALVLNAMVENLDTLMCGGWGVFIAPPTKMVVGEAVCRWAHRTVWCAIGHCPVRQPHHPTVRVRPLELRQLGPPDSHCSLSGAPSGTCSDSARVVAHCSLFTVAFADDRWRSSRCSAWHTGQSGEL
jgi:hypothetical protein